MDITSKHTAIYLTSEEKELLKTVAKSQGLSLSSFMKSVCLRYAQRLLEKEVSSS